MVHSYSVLSYDYFLRLTLYYVIMRGFWNPPRMPVVRTHNTLLGLTRSHPSPVRYSMYGEHLQREVFSN